MNQLYISRSRSLPLFSKSSILERSSRFTYHLVPLLLSTRGEESRCFLLSSKSILVDHGLLGSVCTGLFLSSKVGVKDLLLKLVSTTRR